MEACGTTLHIKTWTYLFLSLVHVIKTFLCFCIFVETKTALYGLRKMLCILVIPSEFFRQAFNVCSTFFLYHLMYDINLLLMYLICFSSIHFVPNSSICAIIHRINSDYSVASVLIFYATVVPPMDVPGLHTPPRVLFKPSSRALPVWKISKILLYSLQLTSVWN